eukprot:4293483-Lingulodinium_polyedra.AAC.1
MVYGGQEQRHRLHLTLCCRGNNLPTETCLFRNPCNETATGCKAERVLNCGMWHNARVPAAS